MRRPMLFVCIFFILLSSLVTSIIGVEKTKKENIMIEGIVKNIEQKPMYTSYTVSNILVNDYTKNNNIKIGDIIRVSGQRQDLSSLKYDEFDYGKYIKSEGYEELIYLNEYSIMGQNKFYKMIGNIKKHIEETFEYLYKDKSPFINSLLIGIKSNLSEEESEMFSQSGTSHIISISGMHIGIITIAIIIFMGKINSLYKLTIISFVLFIYYLIVGNTPSLQRAILSFIIGSGGYFLDKKVDQVSILSIIATILVINNPYIIYNLSFQLSFLATLSIIKFYGYIRSKLRLSSVAITLSANILTIPIIYYKFNMISLISIVANTLITPFIAVIMYISIISIIIFEINVSLAKFIASISMKLIDLIYIILDLLVNINFAYIEIDNPKIYCVAIYYVVIFTFMIYIERKTMKEQINGLQGYYKQHQE